MMKYDATLTGHVKKSCQANIMIQLSILLLYPNEGNVHMSKVTC